MATTLTYLDGYCERHGLPGLWAEPFDVISNLGFILAACMALALFRRGGGEFRKNWDLGILMVLMAAIGIGSGLWHLFAREWALLGDVIPILLFINVYLLSFFLRILKLRWQAAIGWWLIFQGANMASEMLLPRDSLNGSIMYVPTFATLAVIALYLKKTSSPHAREITLAMGLFSVSLALRTVDMTVCGVLPVGTHFLWHVLNSVVLYRLLRLLIKESGAR